ncbi:hypothetical protein CAY62_20720 (plasmid) [Photobacterium damselae subsp. damselae]|nr:hypothetical protein CAY62_20720 [Photobacterium damselae subsp. damselae]
MLSQYARFAKANPIIHLFFIFCTFIIFVASSIIVLYFEKVWGFAGYAIVLYFFIYFRQASSYKQKFLQ